MARGRPHGSVPASGAREESRPELAAGSMLALVLQVVQQVVLEVAVRVERAERAAWIALCQPTSAASP